MQKNHELLRMALQGYELEIEKLKDKCREITAELGLGTATPKPVLVETTAAQPKPRRHFSAATRAKMRKAQRARWAQKKSGKAA